MRDSSPDEVGGKAGGAEPPAAARERGRAVFEEFRQLLHDAARDSVVGGRLARADTSARISLADDAQISLTLLFDREPIEILPEDNGHAPEIQISIHWQDLERVFHENYHLAMAIARGEVTFRGPVRKLLRVMPILQHFAERRGEQRAARAAGESPPMSTIEQGGNAA